MDDQINQEEKRQRQYYAETAHIYDELHVDERDEHALALSFMLGVLDFLDIQSVLDVGSGTGRTLQYLKQHKPNISMMGIEPVKELREIGFSKGIPQDHLIEGDATTLQFKDGAFDLVCEFATLHHIRRPELAVKEMLRVANKAVFISDSNCFGQGSFWLRSLKQVLRFFHLWKTTILIKTKGRGYYYSQGDGISYSYSVYDNLKQIRESCHDIHIVNTKGNGNNPYRSASHIALLGIKNPVS